MEDKNNSWRSCLTEALSNYLDECEKEPNDLHQMIVDDVEQLVINLVLQRYDNNQSLAARILGISRSTLRRKLELK